MLNEEKENKMMPNLIFHNLPESIEKLVKIIKPMIIKSVQGGHNDYLKHNAKVSNVIRLDNC